MSEGPRFSTRNGYERAKEILYRGDIPAEVRSAILEILQWYADPNLVWDRIQELFKNQSTNAFLFRALSRTPGAQGEDHSAINVKRFLISCPWYHIYDLIEDIFAQLSAGAEGQGNSGMAATSFARDINEYFVNEGIGWQLVDGTITMRGGEGLKTLVKTTGSQLGEAAAKHIQDAMQALSRFPEPDLRAAIVHGMKALECTAQDMVGDSKASLEEILRYHPGLLPRPVGSAVSQLWAYATRQGTVLGYAEDPSWYLREGRAPEPEDASMIVGLAATIAAYLFRKHQRNNHAV